MAHYQRSRRGRGHSRTNCGPPLPVPDSSSSSSVQSDEHPLPIAPNPGSDSSPQLESHALENETGRKRRLTAVENANLMVSKRYAKGTKNLYAGRQRRFKEWIQNHESPEVRQLYSNGNVHVPIPEHTLLEFFGYVGSQGEVVIGNENENEMELTVEEDQRTGTYKAVSTLGGYRSAIAALYKEARISHLFPSDAVTSFMAGYKRTIADEKQEGNMNMFEGKRPVYLETFRKLVMYTFAPGYDMSQYLIHTLFMLLCWNLMTRSINVGRMKYNHISWSGDALVITLPKSKTDQEGENHYPKHVYANPCEPSLCPILHLGIKIVSSVKTRKDSNCVFEGNEPENKFSKWLQKLMRGLGSVCIMLLGIGWKEMGTHSFRKGAATYVLSKSGGPTTVAVFQRAGWSIGNTQQRYIFPTEGADQMVGRLLSCLEWNSDDFTTLPPHFLTNTVDDIEWNSIVPGFENYPACFQCVIPYLVASVVYHHEWLEENLPAGHPYFTCYLYEKKKSPALKEYVILTRGYCPETGMTATGLPESMRLASKIGEMESRMEEFKRSMDAMRENMNSNHEDTIERIPPAVVESVLQKIRVEGAVSVTVDDLKKYCSEIREMIDDRFANIVMPAVNNTDPVPNTPQDEGAQVVNFTPFHWGGGFHYLPENYTFPSMTVKNIWDRWLHGVPCQGIPPYRHIVKDFKGISTSKEKVKFSKIRYVVEALLKHVNLSMSDILELGEAETNRLFLDAFQPYMVDNN
jgi:hypothetical protein